MSNSHKLTAADITPALIRDVCDELEIAVPIRSWEITDDGRLRLRLAYSQVATWPARPDEEEPAAEPDSGELPTIPTTAKLKKLTKDEMMDLAQAHDIPGRSSMRKAQLFMALDAKRRLIMEEAKA